LVYKHGQRHGLIPRTQEANPMRFVRCTTTSGCEAMILTPKQAFDVLMHLQEPERTLTLLASATALRISECLGLQWHDVNFEQSQIHVRRTWTCGQVGVPKSKASHAPVPLHPLLADSCLHGRTRPLSPNRRLGIRVFQVQREKTSGRQHVGRISSSARSGQNRGVGERCEGALRVP
jgi:integrase